MNDKIHSSYLVTQENPRVSGALCQKIGTKTKYIYNISQGEQTMDKIKMRSFQIVVIQAIRE